MDVSIASPFANEDLLLCSIFGGLISGIGCGMTVIDAKGYYSNSHKKVIYIVVNRFQITSMKNIIHRIDPKAYVSISEVAEVFTNLQQ